MFFFIIFIFINKTHQQLVTNVLQKFKMKEKKPFFSTIKKKKKNLNPSLVVKDIFVSSYEFDL